MISSLALSMAAAALNMVNWIVLMAEDSQHSGPHVFGMGCPCQLKS